MPALAFFVELIGKRNISRVSVKNQKSNRYTNRDMCFQKDEHRSIFGAEKNIPSCVSCKQGILKKKCNWTHCYETAELLLLTARAWQASYWLRSSLGRQWASDLPGSTGSPLSLGGEQPHFVQPLSPLIWNDVALLCIQGLFWASSKPSCKVQDHYGRQKCSEIAHHCQLITKNPLIADIIINYIPIMTGTIGLSVFLALHWNPKQCRLVGENDLGALGGK